jgi:hypothetical protein
MRVAVAAAEMAVLAAVVILVLVITAQQTEVAVVAAMDLVLDQLVLAALVSLSFATALYKRKEQNAT